MELRDYEHAAARTINQRLDPNARLMDAAAGLAEEAGEVLGLVRKHLYQGRPLDREALAEELGDTLWCVAIAAQSAGIALEEIADANLAKLRRRHPEGFSVGATPSVG